MSDDSVLRDLDLRKGFEHFDERLEDWFGADLHRGYTGRNVGPPHLIHHFRRVRPALAATK